MLSDSTARCPEFGPCVRFWLKLGCISFGGPAGQIAIMHRELVETRRWITKSQFMHALNFCMLLPGPEAQQLATYLGWRLHGAKGGIAAGALFVVPSMLLMFGLSWIFVAGGSAGWLAGIFHGLQAAVVALIFDAVLRMGARAVNSATLFAAAVTAFLATHFAGVSFLWIIAGAGAVGWLGHRLAPRQFPAGTPHAAAADEAAAGPVIRPPPAAGGIRRSVLVAAVCLALWWGPVLLLGGLLGWQSTPAQQGLFFSKAALVTFGGAYAVLPYVAQQAVENFGWLTSAQMMSGLALAETTPGPLVIVLQFVGFVGSWQHPGSLSPVGAALAGSLITTWVTFLPGFLFVFLGAPHIERMGVFPRLGAALTMVTACVVGVILNLGFIFAAHAFWPESGGFDAKIAALSVIAFLGLRIHHRALLPVLGLCAAAGLLFAQWR